jgi:hypothetical protein
MVTRRKLLVSESYVSFAAALQHYGLYDQLLATVSSVSLKKYRTAKIDNTSYKFVQTSVNNFFGWREVNMDGKLIKIASAEKALLILALLFAAEISINASKTIVFMSIYTDFLILYFPTYRLLAI